MLDRLGRNYPKRYTEITRVPPATPTTARPGTKRKVRVLRRRLARGEELWHSLDSVMHYTEDHDEEVVSCSRTAWASPYHLA